MKDAIKSASPVLMAYELDQKGGAKALSEDEQRPSLEDLSTLVWVHLDAGHPQARSWLKEHASYLDDITLSAMLAKETRPRLLEVHGGILVILRGVNLNEGAQAEDMISIRMWVDGSRIITTGLRKLKTVDDIRDLLLEGKGPNESDEFIIALLSRLFERMEPTLLALNEHIDEIEEAVMEDPDLNTRSDVAEVRKQAIMLRRYILPQKEMVAALRLLDLPWYDEQHHRKTQENLDRLTRYIEDLDSVRERAQIIKDELATILSDRMNKNMYVLSVVAALFLPLGFLTGLLGINVGGMPGADNVMAFWYVCALCFFSAVGITGVFKLLKWI